MHQPAPASYPNQPITPTDPQPNPPLAWRPIVSDGSGGWFVAWWFAIPLAVAVLILTGIGCATVADWIRYGLPSL